MKLKQDQKEQIIKKILSLVVFFLFLLTSSCSNTSDGQNSLYPPTTTPESFPTSTSQLQPIPSATTQIEPTPEATPQIQVDSLPEYEILVSFDYTTQRAKVNQTIKYVNTSDIALNNIELSVDVMRYPDVFFLEKITINAEKEIVPIDNNYYLEISLDEPLPPGEKIDLQIIYDLKIPPLSAPADDKKPSIFGYSVVQTNFVDWYPFIPPLDDEGNWVLHDPWFYGEYLVYDLANYYLEIELLNTLPDTSIAASTVATQIEDNFYVFETERARNFVFSISPSYMVESKDVNGITVNTYTFPYHQQAGSHILAETVKAIELFSDIFAPYPRESLSIVEGDFFDGMEYDGLVFLGKGYFNLFDFTVQNYLTFIAVHEAAHQWWYSSVANDQAIEPWLDEAFCTYSEVLYYEFYYPELVDWWWDYRINFYQPDGIINRPIYDYNGFIPYRNATYLQGAKFLQTLRDDLGDEQFFNLVKEYMTNQQDLIATENYFLDLIEKYSGENPLDNYPEYLKVRN